MTLQRTSLFGLVICLAAFAVTAYFYPHLPQRMPIHWDASGAVDGYAPRTWGSLLTPGLMALIWLLFSVLPRIAPRGYRLDTFIGAYSAVMLAILGMLFIVHAMMLLAAAGARVPIAQLVPMLVGLLLLIVGNYMGKIRKNFFIGFRTPWTLANDEVWAQTHRLGGWLMAAAGLLVLVSSAWAATPWILIVTVAIATLTPFAYSFFLYRRIVGLGGRDDD